MSVISSAFAGIRWVSVARWVSVGFVLGITFSYQFQAFQDAHFSLLLLSKAHNHKATTDRRECAFRTYPPHRYYYHRRRPEPAKGEFEDLPSFLTEAAYIRGAPPSVLGGPTTETKICIETHWEGGGTWGGSTKGSGGRLTYTDGFNPSLVPLSEVDLTLLFGNDTQKLDDWVHNAKHVVFVRLGVSQCSYLDNNSTKAAYNISEHDWLGYGTRGTGEPSVAVFLDSNLEWVGQSTVYVELDANFGVGVGKKKGGRVDITRMQRASENDWQRAPGGNESRYEFAHVTKQLDDIRAFAHQGEIWITYYGPDYGYYTLTMVINRVHFDMHSYGQVHVYIKASEVQVICCGRNVALFSDVLNGKLKGVSWVDPLTVEPIDPNIPLRSSANVGDNTSHIHGTNDVMVHLPESSELLGIAHYHRPRKTPRHCRWNPVPEECRYAPYGHHYTHAMYTISDRAPHVLRRVSNEFMFPRSDRGGEGRNDPHIIQFASGLSRVGDNLLISYGINDCEPAIMQLPVERLDALLIKVEPGQEVRDLMRKLDVDGMNWKNNTM